jgi:hypothetical protein
MLGERAGAIHEMKDEGWQKLGQWHTWFSTAPFTNHRQHSLAQELLEGRHETVRRVLCWGGFGGASATSGPVFGLRMFSHSQRKYLMVKKVQGKKCLVNFRKALGLTRKFHTFFET